MRGALHLLPRGQGEALKDSNGAGGQNSVLVKHSAEWSKAFLERKSEDQYSSWEANAKTLKRFHESRGRVARGGTARKGRECWEMLKMCCGNLSERPACRQLGFGLRITWNMLPTER